MKQRLPSCLKEDRCLAIMAILCSDRIRREKIRTRGTGNSAKYTRPLINIESLPTMDCFTMQRVYTDELDLFSQQCCALQQQHVCPSRAGIVSQRMTIQDDAVFRDGQRNVSTVFLATIHFINIFARNRPQPFKGQMCQLITFAHPGLTYIFNF